MHGIVSRWQFQTPPSADLLEHLEQRLVGPISRLAGFRAYYVVFPGPAELLAIHFWESRERAEDALRQGTGWVQDALQSETATVQRSVGEVVVHRQRGDGAPAAASRGTPVARFGGANRFTYRAPPSAELMERTEREVVDPFVRLPGFVAYDAMHTGETEATTVHFWESRTQAEQAVQQAGPWLQRVLGAELAGPPERFLGELVIQRGG